MKKEIKYLSATSLVTLLLLIVSGSFDGVLQRIIYILAFAAPFLLCLYLYYGDKNKEKIFTLEYLTLNKKSAVLTSAFIFPTVTVVMVISCFVTFVMALFGKEKITVITEPPFFAVFAHALLPAFLEEAVFRFLPLRLMGRRAPRMTVFVSAALFALLHHSLFSIPHAFVAGVCFMTIDLMCESAVPSFIVHFVNNVFALMAMGALGFSIELYAVFLILGGLCLLSIIPVFILRKDILARFKYAFEKGERSDFPVEILYVAIPSILIALIELWG